MFEKKTWEDRITENPGRRKLTNTETGEETTVDVENRMADELSDIKSGGKKTRRINKVGEVLQDNNSIPATMAVIANIFASKDVRMGLAGVCLVIGLFFIKIIYF